MRRGRSSGLPSRSTEGKYLTFFPSLTFRPHIAPDLSFRPPVTTLGESTVLLCKNVELPAHSFMVLGRKSLGQMTESGATNAPYIACAPATEGY